ncbi:MAG: hypothetical protein SGPRY_012402 [Prymnesium sp.]
MATLALGAQTAPVGGSERLGTKGIASASNISSSQAKLSLTRRLRDQMLKWYCAQPGNDALSPCKLMDLRAISDPAAKKEKMAALVQMIKSKTKEAQQADIKAEREIYISMYRAYCAQVRRVRAPPKSCALLVPNPLIATLSRTLPVCAGRTKVE